MKKLFFIFASVLTMLITVNVSAAQKLTCADFTNSRWTDTSELNTINLEYKTRDGNWNSIKWDHDENFVGGPGYLNSTCTDQADGSVNINITAPPIFSDDKQWSLYLKSQGLNKLVALPGSEMPGTYDDMVKIHGTFIRQ